MAARTCTVALGTIAFFATTGLLACALAAIGVNVYLLVRLLSRVEETKSEVLGSGLRSTVYEGGTLLAVAAVIYLLAPRTDAHAEDRPTR